MSEPTGKLKFAYQTIKELEAKVMAAHTTVTRLTEKLQEVEEAYTCMAKTADCWIEENKLLRENLEFYDGGETAREILEKTK